MTKSALEHRHKGPTLLVATDQCRRAGHRLVAAPAGLGVDDMPAFRSQGSSTRHRNRSIASREQATNKE
jgi:hypothetical protein